MLIFEHVNDEPPFGVRETPLKAPLDGVLKARDLPFAPPPNPKWSLLMLSKYLFIDMGKWKGGIVMKPIKRSAQAQSSGDLSVIESVES